VIIYVLVSSESDYPQVFDQHHAAVDAAGRYAALPPGARRIRARIEDRTEVGDVVVLAVRGGTLTYSVHNV